MNTSMPPFSPRRGVDFSLVDLPQEIIYHIVERMDAKVVCTLSRTSKYFFSFCNANSVWQTLVDERWGIRNPQSRDWRKYYLEKLTLEKQGKSIIKKFSI
jgi:hypothetical protein